MGDDTMDEEKEINLKIKFQGRDLAVRVERTETVANLKRRLEESTHVLSKKQKLLGLKTRDGRLPTDETPLGDVVVGPKIMLMGTPEEVHLEVAAQEVSPHVQVHDDFDDTLDRTPTVNLIERPEIIEKLKRRKAAAIIKEVQPPRQGKKCAVFDIDYTIFALDSKSENPRELARPYLHEFFAAIYPHYDIIIWSATSMKWIETKLKEIGVSMHPEYKITACMDYTSMVTVDNVPGLPVGHRVFDCKPLQVLWDRYPRYYNSKNTIMLDDLRRNYCLNPQNGLVIRPFKKALTRGKNDKELLKLKEYLLKLAILPSLEHLNHDKWEKYLEKDKKNDRVPEKNDS